MVLSYIGVLSVGLCLRLLVRKYASTDFLDSLTYSSLDQWDSGTFPPLYIHFWSFLLNIFGNNSLIPFLGLLIGSLLFMCKVISDCLVTQDQNKKEVYHTSKGLMLDVNCLKNTELFVLVCYCLNPYSVLSFAAQSTIIVTNIICIWIFTCIATDNFYIGAVLCAVGGYIRMYPGYLLFTILVARFVKLGNKKFSAKLVECLFVLLIFCSTLCALLYTSFVLEGGSLAFVHSVYLHTFTFSDFTPHMGTYWYLFVDMFQHFNEFFIYVFQLLLITMVIGLAMRFSSDPLFACYISWLTLNFLQSYYNIGEFGLILSLIPLWKHLIRFTTSTVYVIPFLFIVALLLCPLFHYMWLQSGTGNVNFYFSGTMVHAGGQVFLNTLLLRAWAKREFYMKCGEKMELSDGSKLKKHVDMTDIKTSPIFLQLDCQNRLFLSNSCAPSPRTLARSSCSSRPTSARSPSHLSFDQYDDVDSNKQPMACQMATRRSYPIVHPVQQIPFCDNCKALDEELARQSEEGSPSHQSPSPQLVDTNKCEGAEDDDEESRSWVMKQPIGPWWWCEDCQDSIRLPHITIGQLFAILRQWTPYAQLQLITIVEEMFRRGAHVDDRDGLTDMTLLHFVAKSGALGDEQVACRIANYLLDEGSHIEARSRWTDMTALHYASYFDCPLVADLLIRRGAQIGSRSFMADDATPLHLAASQLSLGTARILIQAGDLTVTHPNGRRFDAKNARDGLGRTAYDCLPPSGQLPEPLGTLRDLLAELLKPNNGLVDQGFCTVATNDESLLPTSDLNLIDSNYFINNNDHNHNHYQSISSNEQSNPVTNQMVSSGTADWLVAESGFLSPRTRRIPPPVESNDSQSATKQSVSVTLKSMGLSLNDRVCIGPGNANESKISGKHAKGVVGRIGRLRFCGPVSFASGIWVGVELDEPVGRNNGTVAGIKYFTCPAQRGIFAPIGRVYRAVEKNAKQKCHRSPGSQRSATPVAVDNNEWNRGEGFGAKRMPASRSSYSINSAAESGNPNTVNAVHHGSISVAHVTAKVDTGLRSKSPDINTQLQIGDRVLVANQRKGLLRFIGPTQFAPGIWFGVELDQPVGKNNGSLNGIRYFTCAVGHGIFAPLSRIQKLTSSKSSTSSMPSRKLSGQSDLGAPHCAGLTRVHPPWSSTTSPMIGRAVIGRPSLPTELINALKAHQIPIETNQAIPAFYLVEGLQVLCSGEIGIIRYIGTITFAEGIWVGVELRKPRGRHDGAIGDQRYFTCRPGHGIFVRPSRVFCRGINGINLLPPALAELERQLIAAKRLEKSTSLS